MDMIIMTGQICATVLVGLAMVLWYRYKSGEPPGCCLVLYGTESPLTHSFILGRTRKEADTHRYEVIKIERLKDSYPKEEAGGKK